MGGWACSCSLSPSLEFGPTEIWKCLFIIIIILVGKQNKMNISLCLESYFEPSQPGDAPGDGRWLTQAGPWPPDLSPSQAP